MSTAADTTATIARLWVYPIKSCAGVQLEEAVLTETGFDLDRAWMVVDEHGDFVSQREYPRMALIRPQIKQFEVVVRAAGMLALHLEIERVEQPTRVRVWDDTVAAYDMGDVAARWFSMAITEGKEHLRLVRFDPAHQRLANMAWTGGISAPTQFSDGYPLLVCTEASIDGLRQRMADSDLRLDLDRFRPNLSLSGLPAHDEDHIDEIQVGDGICIKLVKPCVRCSIPDVDPQDASSSTAVAQTLAAYRTDTRMQGAVTWGMNAVLSSGQDLSMRKGDTARLSYKI